MRDSEAEKQDAVLTGQVPVTSTNLNRLPPAAEPKKFPWEEPLPAGQEHDDAADDTEEAES